MASRSSQVLVYTLLSIAVLATALWLRLHDAGARLFHVDEGVQSYQAWRLMEGGDYRYDPQEHHGPLLYYAALAVSPLITDAAGDVSDFSMRLLPIGFSLAMVGFGVVAFRRYGRSEALLWALLVSVAPLCVIYGSYFIQEGMLAFFTVAGLYSLYRYMGDPSRAWAVAFGLSSGFMQTLKETAALHLFALLVGAAYLLFSDATLRSRLRKRWLGDAGVAFACVAILHLLFFSSFGQNPKGVWEALLSYVNYAARSQGEGHEKSLFYYFWLLSPRTLEGVRWGELSVLLAVAAGSVFAWLRLGRSEDGGQRRRFARYVTLCGWTLLVVYSVIPYKNPWLLLTPYAMLAYPAASAVASLIRGFGRLGATRVVLSGVGCLLVVWMAMDLAYVTRKAVFQYPSSSRNPYLYMHTTPRYARLLDRLQMLRSEIGEKDFRLGVYSPDAAWPLPWHLRDWENVGYWTEVESLEKTSISLFDTRILDASLAQNDADAFWELHGLRPNTLLALRVGEAYSEVVINKP